MEGSSMARKLIDLPTTDTRRKTKRYQLPKLNGRFGFSLYVGMEEIFIGIAIAPVEIEQITKRRFVKNVKAGVRVLQFD